MKKLFLFYIFTIILTNISFAEVTDSELRFYEDGVLIQRYMGAAVLDYETGNYIFTTRAEPTPTPSEYTNYALWKLIQLKQDLHDKSLYYLDNEIPVSGNCIVPFVNGVMTTNFVYNGNVNTIQFKNGNTVENIPSEYNVNALILLISPNE